MEPVSPSPDRAVSADAPPPPDRASAAWQRFRRIFAFVGLLSVAAAAIAVAAMYFIVGRFELHASIASAIGIGLSVLLGGALMALVFVSNGSGHDQMAHDATGQPPKE